MNDVDESIGIPCSKCSRELTISDEISSLGDLVTYKCPHCGTIAQFLVVRRREAMTEISAGDDDDTIVRVSWSGSKPTAEQIKFLRELSPELSALSAQEALRKLQGVKSWSLDIDLGVELRLHSEREKIIERLGKVGFDIAPGGV